MYQIAQTKGTEDAERTNTERTETELANTTPARADRVEISKEGLALAQQNNEEQEDQAETQDGLGQPGNEAQADITKAL